MNRDGSGSKLRGVSFVDDSLRVETLDPGQRGSIGEADVVGEEEDKVLVIGIGLEELGPFFGGVLEVVVGGGFKIS